MSHAPQSHSDDPEVEVEELQRVVASQREVIAQLQAQRDRDHATIERLTAELTAVLRSSV